jgi:hypothetical protein
MRTGPASVACLFGLPLLLLASSARSQETPRPVQPVPYRPAEPVLPVPVVVAGAPAASPPSAPPAVPGGSAGSAAAGDNVVIHLKDGGSLRGSLIDLLPGDHATVVLATGTSAVVAWSGIQGVERAAVPAPPGSPTTDAPASPPSATTVQSDEPAVLVHIESTRGATLVRKVGAEKCDAPCDRLLPLNGSYRIIGPDIHSSKWFQLEGSPGDRIVIRVSPGLKSTFRLGTVIGGAGFLSAGVGALIVDIANAKKASQHQAASWSGADSVGGAIMLGGLAVMAVGGSLMWANRTSKGAQEVQVPTTEAPEPPRREATWRGPDLLERSLPQAQQLPVVHLSF